MNSHSYNMSKFEKEKQKLIQEKCQTILNDMLRDEDNKYCVDCDAKGPRWASWNLGIFLCIRCAGIHRNLGVHISRVKSVNLDSWTPEQVVTMQQMGNSRARAIYEANMPDSLRRPQTDSSLESFIRAKYEHKKYIAKEWVQPAPVKVNWDSEIEESMRKTKEAKKAITPAAELGPIPTPVQKPTTSISTAAVTAKAPVIDVRKVVAIQQAITPNPTPNGHSLVSTSASEDLLGLTSDSFSLTSTNLLPTHETSSMTSISTNNSADDLGSIFLSPQTSGSTELGKMSKESILSLYGSGPTTPTMSANPFIPPATATGGSSFGMANINSQSSGGLGGQGSSFSQPGGFGYTSNPSPNFPGPITQHSIQQQAMSPFPAFNQMGVSSPGFGGQPQRNDIVQMQNQFLGLNLGNQAPPQTQFSNEFVQNAIGNSRSPFGAQNFGQIPVQSATMNSQFQAPVRADNLPGLGNSVSQLMQPNLSGSNFWK